MRDQSTSYRTDLSAQTRIRQSEHCKSAEALGNKDCQRLKGTGKFTCSGLRLSIQLDSHRGTLRTSYLFYSIKIGNLNFIIQLSCRDYKNSKEFNEGFGSNLDDLGVRHHGGVAAGDVHVALVELAEAAAVHLRIVTPIHLYARHRASAAEKMER